MSPIVFLHIPKTAGQAVHNALVQVVGGQDHVSPVRVREQAQAGRQMPKGYRLYSGHIDWTEMELLPKERFAFTILRDPRERIASFYLYMRKLAESCSPQELSMPENHGRRMALELSADAYFFGGSDAWHRFVRVMYDNFYCSYFATRRMTGWGMLENTAQTHRIAQAQTGLKALNAVYTIDQLDMLEHDIAERFGERIQIAGQYFNTGGHSKGESRWSKLCERFEKDNTRARLEEFVRLDEVLIQTIGLRFASTRVDKISVESS